MSPLRGHANAGTGMKAVTEFGSSNSVVYVAVPDEPRYVDRARVRKFLAGFGPRGHRHRWFEMDHYGGYGTGFAMCACGAVGRLSYEDDE